MSHEIDVEILIDGSWVSICDDTLGRDRIRITRGRQDWASRVEYSRADITLKNAQGRYSPRNPQSPYYGKLGRNTPLRVTVDGRPRFLGEVAEWPQRAAPDIHVPLEAVGVLRRLSEREEALRSVLRRTILDRGELPVPVAYWPCEDGSESTALWSALPNRRPANFTEGVSLAAYDGFGSSDPIPELSDGAQWYGNVAAYTSSVTTVAALVHFSADAFATNGQSFLVANGTGTGSYWRVQVNIDRTIRLQLADEDGATIVTSSNSAWSVGSAGGMIVLQLTQNGANVNWTIRKLEGVPERFGRFTVAVPILTGTFNSRTVGRISRITVGANSALKDTAIGHVAVWDQTISTGPLWAAVDGYIGEPAGRRIERLCLEEGVPLAVVGDLDDTQRMGAQRSKGLTDLLDECSDVDGGILYEPTAVETTIGGFDTSTDGWTGAGSVPPAVARSTTRSHSGAASLLVTWQGGSSDQIAHVAQPERYVVGTTYTARAWLWVPSGSTHVSIAVGGVGFGPPTTVTDQWQQRSMTWTCTSTDNEVQFWAQTPAGVGAQVWIDDVSVSTDKPGLAYRTRRSMYNVDPTLTLDFDQAQVALPLEPVDDDQLLRQFGNSVTATRTDGGSYTKIVADGPMSIQDPPNGVGLYVGNSGPFNLELDQHLALLTCWRAYLGTWDEQRFPRLSVNLRRQAGLADAACAADLGHRISVVNPPEWLPPQTIEQQVQGTEEELDHNLWLLHYNCTPWRPFRAPTVGVPRLDSTKTTLNADIDADDVSVVVTVESGSAMWIRSSQKPALFPFVAVLCVDGAAGEEVSVTAISAPTGQNQTFTIVRGLNMQPRAWSAGTQVRVKDRQYVTW